MIINFGFINFKISPESFIKSRKILLLFIIFLLLVVFISLKFNFLWLGFFSVILAYILTKLSNLLTKQAYGLPFTASLNKYFKFMNRYITKGEIKIYKRELMNYETFEERDNFNIIFTELSASDSFNSKKDIYSQLEEVQEMMEVLKNENQTM